MKKKLALLVLCSMGLGILTSGCETAKGMGQGFSSTARSIGSIGTGAAEGAAKDTKNLWQAILKTDAWIKKNLW